MGENKEFSDWVKRAKVATTEKGVTIVEIAEELGTATNYLYGIMSGRVFSQPMIQRVSDYLGIEGVAKRDKGWELNYVQRMQKKSLCSRLPQCRGTKTDTYLQGMWLWHL